MYPDFEYKFFYYDSNGTEKEYPTQPLQSA